MNDPKRRFFSGDSLQQALVQAANHFHLQPEEIAFHPVEKRHGFVKVRRKVVIEVNPDAPRKAAVAPPAVAPPAVAPSPGPRAPRPPAAAPSTSDSRPVAGRSGVDVVSHGAAGPPAGVEADESDEGPDPWNRAEPLPPARGGPPPAGRAGGGPGDRQRPGRQPRATPPPGVLDVEDEMDEDLQPAGLGQGLVALPERPRSIAERFVVAVGPQAEAAARGIELLLRIAGLSLQAKIYQGEERLEVDLSGADTDWCFADDGEMLMSIEHLLPRIIRSLSGEAVLCRVDCDNFHEIREERLRSLAQKVADEVRLKGRPRTLVPMNPADRRIIHVTLADNPAVVTESEGDGYFKRITVRPA
jgi:predicted RNA-binding protein Jag